MGLLSSSIEDEEENQGHTNTEGQPCEDTAGTEWPPTNQSELLVKTSSACTLLDSQALEL